MLWSSQNPYTDRTYGGLMRILLIHTHLLNVNTGISFGNSSCWHGLSLFHLSAAKESRPKT